MAAENSTSGSLGDVTLRAFRWTVLRDLETNGAGSVTELAQRPISVFGVPLNEEELRCAVESARRFGHVKPLGHPRHADGSFVAEDEWSVTDRGRTETAGFLTWSWRGAGPARKALPGIVGVLSATGVLAAVGDVSVELETALAVAAGVAWFLFFRSWVAWADERGRWKFSTALRWGRLQVERCDLYEEAKTSQRIIKKDAAKWFTATVAVIVLVAALVVVVLEWDWNARVATAGFYLALFVYWGVLLSVDGRVERAGRAAPTRPPACVPGDGAKAAPG